MKPCVILNPTSGSITDLDAIMSHLRRLTVDRIEVTQKAGDAEEFAHEAVRAGCNYIIAAGGDGTLNEVLNGVAEDLERVRIGLVPLGTGNDFARSLKLPAAIDENIGIL